MRVDETQRTRCLVPKLQLGRKVAREAWLRKCKAGALPGNGVPKLELGNEKYVPPFSKGGTLRRKISTNS
jgi:hypothetical protein